MKRLIACALMFAAVLSSSMSYSMESIAHRGFSGKYRENSLEAIRKAWELGCDLVEIDLTSRRLLGRLATLSATRR